MARATNPRDIGLGLAATGVRAGTAVWRLVLGSAKVAARAPVVGPAVRRAGDGLAEDGVELRSRGIGRLESATDELLAAPELERAIDRALAGPLTDSVARSLAQHRVAERVAAQIAASPEFEQALADALEHEATRRLADRALESRLVEELTERMLRGPELERVVAHVASSPEVRAALARQTTSLAEEVVGGVRRGAERADDRAERRVSAWLRRRSREETGTAPYAGVATRALGLAIDVLLAQIVFLTGAALVGLVASLVGELRPAWLVAVLAAAAWLVVSGAYFVLFWAAAGQTPGMRLLRLRVLDGRGRPPGLTRSVVRFFGLLLAIVPLFAGFLPALFDARRRGLHDLLARTVVVYADREQLVGVEAAALEPDAAVAPIGPS
jgi:uncharacterized RDD family membrane protein YckC